MESGQRHSRNSRGKSAIGSIPLCHSSFYADVYLFDVNTDGDREFTNRAHRAVRGKMRRSSCTAVRRGHLLIVCDMEVVEVGLFSLFSGADFDMSGYLDKVLFLC